MMAQRSRSWMIASGAMVAVVASIAIYRGIETPGSTTTGVVIVPGHQTVPDTSTENALSAEPTTGTIREADLAGPPGMRSRVVAEPRDRSWSDREEALLNATFAGVPDATGLSVQCSASLCVVRGEVAGQQTQETIQRFMVDMQTRTERLTGAGETLLPGASVSFEPSPQDAGRLIFSTYLSRAPAQ